MSILHFDTGTSVIKARVDNSASDEQAGIFFRRNQVDNNTGSGDVVNTAPQETGQSLASTTTTITMAELGGGVLVRDDDYYVGWWIQFVAGPATSQVRQITSFNSTTKVAEVSSPFTVSPGLSIYYLYYASYVGMVFHRNECEIGRFPNTVGFAGNALSVSNINGYPGHMDIIVGQLECSSGIKIRDVNIHDSSLLIEVRDPVGQSVTIPGTASADFILSEGDQLLNGVKTFSSDLVIQPGGAGNTFTIASTNPAANRVYTVPDIAVDGSLTVEETTTLSSNYVDNGGGATYITGYSHQITRKNNQVTITFPTDSATFSGASTQVRTLSALDARFRPTSASQAFPARIQSVGVAQFGYVSVGTDGIITWYKDAAQTAWSGVANDRLFATSVTYNIA